MTLLDFLWTEQLYKNYRRWTKKTQHFHRMRHMEEILFFYALLTLFAAIGLHMCKSKSFFPTGGKYASYGFNLPLSNVHDTVITVLFMMLVL